MRSLIIGCLMALFVSLSAMPGWAGVWDMDMPYQGDNPQWVKVKTLWNGHWDGENLDALIAELILLKDKHPDTVEPYLWLAKTYYLKARWDRKERQTNFKQAENYVLKAHEVDPGNILALKLIVDIMSFSGDTRYALARYGDWIRGGAPFPVAEALPALPVAEKTKRFQLLWGQRAQIDKAIAAVQLLKELSTNYPKDGLTQVWASRAYYYLGLYYTSLGKSDAKAQENFEQGLRYGETALKLMPQSVPAHYWYALNLAGWVRNAGLFSKMRYAKGLMDHMLFCSRENAFYYMNGPMLEMGLLGVQGGWFTRQRVKRAGITPEVALSALDLAALLYPEDLAIPYTKARILALQGERDEAATVVARLLAKNPDANKILAADNRCYYRLAHELSIELKAK